MSKPKEIKFVDDDPAKPNPWKECRVFAAISPTGQLITRFADLAFANWAKASAGQSAITLNSGKAAIHPEFEKRGFVLYEDLCKGRVEGVEASPKHWDIWLRYVKLRAEGHEPAPGSITPERFWHPEVLRRRANAEKGGLAHMDATRVAAFLGFDDVDVESELFDEG
jgi:hypothetical protein